MRLPCASRRRSLTPRPPWCPPQAPPVTGLSGASRLWVPSNRFLRPAPSPALLPEAAVSVDCVKALTGRLEDAAGLAGRSRRGAGAFWGSGRRKGRTGFPSGLGLWGRRSPVSNTCSVTVTALAQELPSEQHGQDAAPPGARVLAEGRTRRDAPALRKPRKEEENVKAPAIARPSVSCPSSRDRREAGAGGRSGRREETLPRRPRYRARRPRARPEALTGARRGPRDPGFPGPCPGPGPQAQHGRHFGAKLSESGAAGLRATARWHCEPGSLPGRGGVRGGAGVPSLRGGRPPHRSHGASFSPSVVCFSICFSLTLLHLPGRPRNPRIPAVLGADEPRHEFILHLQKAEL